MNILRLLIGLLLAVVASVVLGQLYGPRLFDTRPSRPIQVKPASQPTQAVPTQRPATAQAPEPLSAREQEQWRELFLQKVKLREQFIAQEVERMRAHKPERIIACHFIEADAFIIKERNSDWVSKTPGVVSYGLEDRGIVIEYDKNGPKPNFPNSFEGIPVFVEPTNPIELMNHTNTFPWRPIAEGLQYTQILRVFSQGQEKDEGGSDESMGMDGAHFVFAHVGVRTASATADARSAHCRASSERSACHTPPP